MVSDKEGWMDATLCRTHAHILCYTDKLLPHRAWQAVARRWRLLRGLLCQWRDVRSRPSGVWSERCLLQRAVPEGGDVGARPAVLGRR